MTAVTDREFWRSRVQDMKRHLADLEHDYYEEAKPRSERDEVFRRAFDLLTPVAERVLGDMNDWLLDGHGTVATQPVHHDGDNGLEGSWTLSWPRLEQAKSVYTDAGLPPVTIAAVYPGHWTHGHLARIHTGLPAEVTAWPMQVRTEEDAERQEPVLRMIAEAELHERIYQTNGDWRLCLAPDQD